MGKCWGITKNFSRCKNNAGEKWFCHKHATLLKRIVSIAVITIILSYIATLLPKPWKNKVVIVPDPLSQSDLTEIAQFNHTLFFHKSDKKPLDDHLRGDGASKFGGFQFRGKLPLFISNQLNENENLIKAEYNQDIKKIVEFYHNMILIKLIDHFFWMYSARWDTNVFFVRGGTMKLKNTYVDSEETPPNYDYLTWEHLLNKEQQNNFYDLLLAFSNFTNIKETKVPPKTKTSFIITESNKEMVLNNPFVKVTIAINKRGASLGLGNYKRLLGHDYNSEEFWSAHFSVNCNAKFEKSKYSDPDIPKYKKWVEVMFEEVQYLLDEEEQLKRAHEYRDLI